MQREENIHNTHVCSPNLLKESALFYGYHKNHIDSLIAGNTMDQAKQVNLIKQESNINISYKQKMPVETEITW